MRLDTTTIQVAAIKAATLTTALLLGGVVYLSASADDDIRPNPARPAEPLMKRVRTAPVEAADGKGEARFPGMTRAVRRARLAFLVGGRLLARPVEVGDSVVAGTLVARLDSRELENAWHSARAALVEATACRLQAERDCDRSARLLEARAATREEHEQATAATAALAAAEEAARARLAEAERRLAETELRAPFNGIVTQVLLEAGENAVPGRGVVVLSGTGGIEAEIEVPAAVVRAIQPGDPVEVDLRIARSALRPGHVRAVSRATNGPGRLFPVVVALADDPDLIPGMTVEIVLRLASNHGTTGTASAVPVAAVVDPGGGNPSVFRLRPTAGARARAEKLSVEVNAFFGDRILVDGPLAVGENVVVAGHRGLVDGDLVEMISED